MTTIPADGGRISHHRLGSGRPLLVLSGLAATSADWDPSFIDRLASASELVLVDNRGIGASTDDGAPFDIAKLAADTAQAIKTLDLGAPSVLGWSMGGFIAQTLALDHPNCVHKLILLSTDPGGADTELGSPAVRAQLADMSGTPHEQARRLLSLLFPADVAESFYREFGDIVAAARAQLAPELVHRQSVAMDSWHRNGAGDRLRSLRAPTLVATGTEDIVIPPSNSLALVNAIPGAWLAQFSGGGHAFIAQYPRQLADLINEFLLM
ncbi:MAG TPA: alpha/beta hydrolase [Candidatus Binatus sp.]|nr:alpha/beta hydrolase [Candidatus Binatus sp.]